MLPEFLGEAGKALYSIWKKSDCNAREKMLNEQMQNKLDATEPCYNVLLDVVHEAVRRRAADLDVLSYGNPDQYRIIDRPGVMRNSDHIRIANGRTYFAVAIRCRRLRHGESYISLREFREKFQAALDEVTTYWGYPDFTVHSVSRVVRTNGNFLGVILT